MKTKSLHCPKLYSLFSIILLALFLGLSNMGWGQTKTENNNVGSGLKEAGIQMAAIHFDKLPEINQVPETEISNDESVENNSNTGPSLNAPLATRTASVSGVWSSTATWGGSAVPTSADAVIINSAVTVTIDIANAQCLSLTMNRPATGATNTINVNANTLTCGSLILSATTTTRNNIINITTGTMNVTGAITTGTTGCKINITGAGTINVGGTTSGTPTLTFATTSTVNYTSGSAQTIIPGTYGNLALSGAGTKTIAANLQTRANGNFTNSSTVVISAGVTAYTYLIMGGNVTNTGTINATAANTNFYFIGSTAQTFTNNGIVTAPVASLVLQNAAGLTLLGSNQIVCQRVNLFYGTITNSNKITLGNGGTSFASVQRGVAANTSPAGSFDVAPVFNIGTSGYVLVYDNGSVAYNTGNEVPGSLTTSLFAIYDAADVSLNSDLTVTDELNFAGGTGTPSLRIGAHTLTLGDALTYTAPGAFYGGTTSNLVMNGVTASPLNAITNGLNDLTINNSGGITLGGAFTVNGILTLTDGLLINGTYLTMATGAKIVRTATGTLTNEPNFETSVDLAYSGSSAINTGYEIPTSTTVLNNLTTNVGGVIQSEKPTGTVSTLYSQGFNGAPSDWTTEIVTNPAGVAPTITYVTSATSTYPTVTPSEGTQCVQFNSYDCEAGDQIRLKKNSSPLTTTGKTNITVVFDWYFDATYSDLDYVTVQWSSNGTAWNNSNSYYRYNGTSAWATINCALPVGAENQPTLYVAFLFTGAYGDNCHLDNMKVNVNIPGTPIPTTCTVNGTLDLTAGTYTIGLGASNPLVINGSLSGSSAFIGGTTSNLTVSGTGSNLTLPAITNGLNNFTIDRPNGVTIPSTGSLTVAGTLSNNDGTSGLTIKSGGSLIESTTAVDATVESDIPGNEWHLISLPISNATAEMVTGKFLQTHLEGLNSYTDVLDITTALTPMKGFALWGDAAGFTANYAGPLNTGALNYSTSYSGAGKGWNLVGNPYASSIDWNASSGWTKSNINSTIYLHVNNATWATWNGSVGTDGGTQYVAPCQGFFVEANAAGSLGMNNSVRVHNNTSFFKNSQEAVNNMIRLQASGNGYTNEAVVWFLPEATAEFDNQYDAHKLFGDVAEAAQLYTLGNTPLAINALPETNVVQVGMHVGASGVYTIAATEVNEISAVTLEDTQTGIFTNLLQNSYTFNATAGEVEQRFILHFGTLSVKKTENTVAGVYANHGVVYINMKDNAEGDIYIYNVTGQLVSTVNATQGINKINIANTGNYIVKVITKKSTMVKKVFIQ